MITKHRVEPLILQQLKHLKNRSDLPEENLNYLYNLEKGWEGERRFDSVLEEISSDCLILNDLLLEVNNTTFQIDSLLICQQAVYLYEVKNYEGDFYMEGDRFYAASGSEIKNPIQQLKRSESLLRQLLQQNGYKFTISASLVFVNPEFTLYQAPLNSPIIFPTQLNRYMKKISNNTQKLNQKHHKLAKHLASLHSIDNSFAQLPPFDFESLKKGVVCPECCSFLKSVNWNFVCDRCGYEERAYVGVKRSVEELILLLPKHKITTRTVHEWCGRIRSRESLKDILCKSYQLVSRGQSSYYIIRKEARARE
ncbi:NERD domain-containing protein [Radiobacillus sp. PE A8.2]|uniref:NERD domain-containing protein n=1 Tax=Radiobacillus sp. PE A8.2 TaxID=3380349 RepID=UPI00388CFF2C